MTTYLKKTIAITLILFATALSALAQDDIQTVFKGNSIHSGGYGAISNKFTTIRGEFANLVEIYGGWFINKRILLGVEAAALTNRIKVPAQYSTLQNIDMSYEYGQVGFLTEYVIASNKAVHVNLRLMAGAGFTLQYIRSLRNEEYDYIDYDHDENWFFVAEPGIQVEINLLRWMRFSPGVSYRFVQNTTARGISADDITGASVDLTLKFGKF